MQTAPEAQIYNKVVKKVNNDRQILEETNCQPLIKRGWRPTISKRERERERIRERREWWLEKKKTMKKDIHVSIFSNSYYENYTESMDKKKI